VYDSYGRGGAGKPKPLKRCKPMREIYRTHHSTRVETHEVVGIVPVLRRRPGGFPSSRNTERFQEIERGILDAYEGQRQTASQHTVAVGFVDKSGNAFSPAAGSNRELFHSVLQSS